MTAILSLTATFATSTTSSSASTSSPTPTSTSTSSSLRDHLFQPTSTKVEPFWHEVPNERSTVNLVTSCVLTLIMCVWTAIHLNIPSYKERKKGTFWPYIWRRMAWMVIGLIAPEVVLYAAWQQFIQARLVSVRLGRIETTERAQQNTFPSFQATDSKPIPSVTSWTGDIYHQWDDDHDFEDGTELSRKKAPTSSSHLLPTHHTTTATGTRTGTSYGWTGSPYDLSHLSSWERMVNFISPNELERGYYAVMGGFEIVLGSEIDPASGETWDIRRTVTPCGTILLARLGLLPPLSVESINDKSKADILTKGLVCVQGLWMLAQGLGRKVEDLPVTLLELNTIMHVVCALAMYILWLKKPQDVGIPTRIDDKHPSRPLGALMSIKHVYSTDAGPEEQYVVVGPEKQAFGVLQYRDGVFTYKPAGETKYEVIWPQSQTDPEKLKTLEADAVQVYNFWIHRTTSPSGSILPGYFIEFSRKGAYLTPRSAMFLVEYSSASASPPQGLQPYKPNPLRMFGKKEIPEWSVLVREFEHNGSFGCAKNAANFRLEGQIQSWGGAFAGWTAAIVFPAIYGGVHLTPWRSHFPTHLERYLWRFSGLYVAAGIPGLLVLFALTKRTLKSYNVFILPFTVVKNLWKLASPRLRKNPCLAVLEYPVLVLVVIPAVWTLVAVWAVGLLSMAGLYVLVRVYIMVEAFASLRSLPEGAYKTVGWTEMWPHF